MRLQAAAIIAAAAFAASCGSTAPMVTVRFLGEDPIEGPCPTPPGGPSPCDRHLRATAYFVEHAGAEADVSRIALRVCYGETCYEYPPSGVEGIDDPKNGFHLAGNEHHSIYFRRDYGRERTRVSIIATVSGTGGSYTIEGVLESPGDA